MYKKKWGHLRRIVGDVDINTIDSTVVDRYIIKRKNDGASANSIHKELSTLRGVLRQAKRDKKWRGDLAEVMPIAFDPEYTPRQTFIKPDALKRLLHEFTPNHAAAAAFIVAGACRLSDMVRAEPSDLTSVPGYVRVRRKKTKKNREGFHLVPITRLNEWLVKDIKAATHGRTRKLFEPWTNIVRDLEKAASRASACERCRHGIYQRREDGCPLCERIEIVPRVTPNDLRRTHAMWLRAEGVEPSLIGEVLNHVDGRMVERVYGRITPDALARLLSERLDVRGKNGGKNRRGEPGTGKDERGRKTHEKAG